MYMSKLYSELYLINVNIVCNQQQQLFQLLSILTVLCIETKYQLKTNTLFARQRAEQTTRKLVKCC